MQLKAKQAALATQQKVDLEKSIPSVTGDKAAASERTPLIGGDTIKARHPEDVALR